MVDENGVILRRPHIGTQFGATASAFSLLKVLASTNIGCVLGPAAHIDAIRNDLSSQGSQVRGEDARDALEAMVYAPVALAIQHDVVDQTTSRINDLVAGAGLPDVFAAVACQPIVPSVVLVLNRPVASTALERLRAEAGAYAWVTEESRFSARPVFSTMPASFLGSQPEIGNYLIRINPIRSGPETLVRIIRSVFGDRVSASH
jgi:hypothetical protein